MARQIGPHRNPVGSRRRQPLLEEAAKLGELGLRSRVPSGQPHRYRRLQRTDLAGEVNDLGLDLSDILANDLSKRRQGRVVGS
jgi:hypothetical protein